MMAKDNDWNYEATVAKAEDILQSIESGDLELAETFSQSQIAAGYLRECEEFLVQQQESVELLVENLGESF